MNEWGLGFCIDMHRRWAMSLCICCTATCTATHKKYGFLVDCANALFLPPCRPNVFKIKQNSGSHLSLHAHYTLRTYLDTEQLYQFQPHSPPNHNPRRACPLNSFWICKQSLEEVRGQHSSDCHCCRIIWKSITVILGLLTLGKMDAMKSTILLLCSILCITCASSQHAWADDLVSAAQRLGAKNTLNFGEKCSFEDEIRRDDLQKKIIKVLSSMDKSAIHDLTASINNLLQSSGQFCKAFMNTQCNSTGYCDCANSDLMGLKVRSVREGGACRLASGSACAPPELLPEVQGQNYDLKCEVKSHCVVKSNGKVCSAQNMQDDIKKHIGGRQVTQSDLVKDYCVCGAGGLRSSHLFAILAGFLVFLLSNPFSKVLGV